jgi:hypothetical protein
MTSVVAGWEKALPQWSIPQTRTGSTTGKRGSLLRHIKPGLLGTVVDMVLFRVNIGRISSSLTRRRRERRGAAIFLPKMELGKLAKLK